MAKNLKFFFDRDGTPRARGPHSETILMTFLEVDVQGSEYVCHDLMEDITAIEDQSAELREFSGNAHSVEITANGITIESLELALQTQGFYVMSNILDMLLGGKNDAALKELSQQFDLNETQTRNAVEELIPALSRGVQKNTSSAQGLDDLLDALKTGEHAKYMDEPTSLGKPATTKDGNDILGHIFGSKEVSREVANQVSQKSGISSAILKKMLPVVATMVMGALSKGVLGGSKGGVSRAKSGGLLAMLLDSDRDGSIWDDVLGMAARTLLR